MSKLHCIIGILGIIALAAGHLLALDAGAGAATFRANVHLGRVRIFGMAF